MLSVLSWIKGQCEHCDDSRYLYSLTCRQTHSPPPSPVFAVYSWDFGSLHSSLPAWPGVSPVVQGRPGNPGAASEWLSEPTKPAVSKQQCMFPADVFLLYNTQYLHALQLLFAEGVLFLQRLILDLHTDELFLHFSTLILQLRYKTSTQYRLSFLHSIFHLAYMQNSLVLDTAFNCSACFFTSAKRELPLLLGSWACCRTWFSWIWRSLFASRDFFAPKNKQTGMKMYKHAQKNTHIAKQCHHYL